MPRVRRLYLQDTLLIYLISFDLAIDELGPCTSALSLPAKSIKFSAATATSPLPAVLLLSIITLNLPVPYMLCDLELL